MELHVYFILYNIRYVRTFYIHDRAETHARGGGLEELSLPILSLEVLTFNSYT